MKQIQTVQAEACATLVERDGVVEAMFRAILARQHVLLLGAAGIAKSKAVHEVTERIADARMFKRVLRRDSTSDEVFGAVSLKGLENDIYRRNITGKLPDAEFAFLDEVFKCNSTVLNGLLDIINERTFENDSVSVRCPLITLFGASNEDAQGEELDAFRDRFLVILIVKDIQEDTNFKRFLQMRCNQLQTATKTKLALADINAAISATQQVSIPDDVLEAITKLRRDLHVIGIRPSPRRIGNCLDYIKASAYMDGRTVVDCDDLMVLKDCLWSNKDSIPELVKILANLSNPDLGRVIEIMDAAKQTYDLATASSEAQVQLEANTKLRSAKKKLEDIGKANASPKVRAKVEAGIVKIKEYHAAMLKALGMGSL